MNVTRAKTAIPVGTHQGTDRVARTPLNCSDVVTVLR
jgi:hypothetical protein